MTAEELKEVDAAWPVDDEKIDYLLSLTPEARILRHGEMLELVKGLKSIGVHYLGVGAAFLGEDHYHGPER